LVSEYVQVNLILEISTINRKGMSNRKASKIKNSIMTKYLFLCWPRMIKGKVQITHMFIQGIPYKDD